MFVLKKVMSGALSACMKNVYYQLQGTDYLDCVLSHCIAINMKSIKFCAHKLFVFAKAFFKLQFKSSVCAHEMYRAGLLFSLVQKKM